MEASRWDRLDEISRRLDRYEARLRQVEEDIELLGRIDERLKHVEYNVGECLTSQKSLTENLAKREEQAKLEHKQQRHEQIIGRRWIIGSIIAASGVIVGAVGLIVAVIDKAPT